MSPPRAKVKYTFIILTFIFYPTPTRGENTTHPEGRLSEHPLNIGWICSSVISAIGVILNSLVFFIFFKERNSFITSVNAMIMFVKIICL